MPTPVLYQTPRKIWPCISLIGMAGCGKSTVGELLAAELGWAFIDSDKLLEALYATRLQDITDALGKEAFLDVEGAMIQALNASRAVIATGGSVVYRREAMRHLRALGPVVWLDVPFALIEERIARNPERGLAIAPGQTVADIHNERLALYRAESTLACRAGSRAPDEICREILQGLPEITAN